MAPKHAIIFFGVLFGYRQAGAQESCSSAIALSLNGVIANFSTSASTGSPVVCMAYPATSPVTWFSFTTGAVTACPLLDIEASDHHNCEVAFYTGCGGNMNNNLDAGSSMCFDDGEGLWAPAQTFAIQPNHTYFLRVKTSTNCTISIGGQYYSPSNNNCSGALSITTSSFADNNSCNKPSGEVSPGQLCAFTLENTAFYKFYVASAGSAIININGIACDNGDGNNSNGFQIGFFTGSCGALVPINCVNGSGSFVQASTNPLPAGSLVYVAIDGVSGSNCRYGISGVNVWGALSTNFKNFSAWQTATGNDLKWICLNDTSAYYTIERSMDGINFTSIGRVNHPNRNGPSTEYLFQDEHPLRTSFYRVKQVDDKGKISMSQVLTVVRKQVRLIKFTMPGTIHNSLDLLVETDSGEQLQYAIIDMNGQCYSSGSFTCGPGITRFHKETAAWPPGRYILVARSNDYESTRSFLKLN